ncbi:protein FAM13B-like [Hoplias malabaricus]|uniref:protein FAM13B-like n=1 Tax=Hoplias malabaricus TaxID=27720 RepID=UPI0034618B7D
MVEHFCEDLTAFWFTVTTLTHSKDIRWSTIHLQSPVLLWPESLEVYTAQDRLKTSCSFSAVQPGFSVSQAKPALEDTVKTLTQRLKDKRLERNLPECVEDMSQAHLAVEKITLQKCLLYYEGLHGRPKSREERSVMRELYDRYRSVKHALYTSNTQTTTASEKNEGCSQQPVFSTVSVSMQAEHYPAFTSQMEEVKQGPAQTENTQFVDRTELLRQLKETRKEKRRLRKILKEYEKTVLLKTGRRLQKADLVPMAAEYNHYKTVKARLRFLKGILGKTHTSKAAR